MLNEDACVVSTFSWYSNEDKILSFRAFFEQLSERYPDKKSLLFKNVIFCGNSLSEYLIIKQIMPISHPVFFNNAAMISERIFSIEMKDRIYDAVVNAKPCLFKRHYLLGDTRNWLFITYKIEETRNSPDFFDISKLPHAALVKDIPNDHVSGFLNQCHSGVILSEVEGIAAASLEYLLSGIPVVSTKSLGGRDEFYTSKNSIIVEPRTDSIMTAVAKLTQASAKNEIDRVSIRDHAIGRMREFRRTLAAEIAHCLNLKEDRVFSQLESAIEQSSKLQLFRTGWQLKPFFPFNE
jgi:glycosyltransferase involved in cell wall biosynthesis